MYSLHDITSRCVKIEKPEPTYNRESPQGSSVHGLSAVKVEKRDTSCNLQIHQVMSGNEVVIQDGIPTRGEMLSMPMNTLQEMQEEMSASEMDIRLGELSSNQAQRKYSYEVDTQDVMPVYQIGSYEQVSIDQIGTQEDMSTDRMVTQKELPQMTTGDGECRNLTYPYKGRSPNQTRDSERQLSHQIGVHAEVSTYKRRSQDGLPLYQVSGAQEMPPYLLGTQGNMASHQIGVQGGMSGYQAITQKRLSPRQIGSEQEQSNHQMGTQAKISNHQIGAQEGMSGFQVASDEGIATRPDGLSTPKIGTHRRMSGYHMGTQEEMTSHHMGSPETRQMGSQEGIPSQQIGIQDVMSAKQMVSQNGLSTRQGSAFLETSGFQLDIEDGMLIHQKGPQNGLSAKQMASPNGLSTSQVGAHPEMPAYPFGMQDRMLSHQMSAQNGMSVKQMVSPNGLSTNKVDAHPEISGFHLGMQDGIPSHQMSPQNGLSARQMGSQNGMSAHQIGAHPEMSGYQLNIQDGMSTHQMGSQNGKSSRQIDTKGRLPRYQMGPYGAMPAYQRLSHERMPPYPTANYDKISTYKTELHESGTHERMQFQEMNYLGSMATPRSSTHSCHCSCHSPSQPQLSHFPAFGEENQRPSVIMVPFTKSKPVLGSPQLYSQVDFSGLNVHRDDQRLGFNGPQHNGNDMEFSDDSDSSDGGDNERSQEKYFRRTIDGTTAKFKLSKEEWKRIPINTFPSGGRLLSGDWTRIFLSKVKESNPWCSLRFKNNHVRSENSRKIHSAVFFRGGAECKRPECNVKVRFVIRKEKGKYVDVTYVGNVCHNSQPGGSDVTTDRRRNKRGRRPRPSSA